MVLCLIFSTLMHLKATLLHNWGKGLTKGFLIVRMEKNYRKEVDKMTNLMNTVKLYNVWDMVDDTLMNNSRSVVLSAFLC